MAQANTGLSNEGPDATYWSPSSNSLTGGGATQPNSSSNPQPQQTQAPTPQSSQPNGSGDASGNGGFNASGVGGGTAAAGAMGQIPGTPVSATGQIPSYTPPPPPAPVQPQVQYQAPAAPSTQNPSTDARQVQPTAAQTSYQGGAQASTLSSNPGVSSLMNAILAKPDTLDANTIAQMKEQQKQQALLLGKQNNDALTSSILARGGGASGGLNSGFANAGRTANDWNTNNAIINANTGVDVTAANTNRQAELNALTAAGGINASDLAAIQANNADKQTAAASAQTANQDMFARAVAAAQAAQGAYGQDSNNNQFGANLTAQQRQQDQALGFNYDQLQQNGQLTQEQILQQLMNS